SRLRFEVRRCSGTLNWLEERPSEIFGWLPELSGGYGSIGGDKPIVGVQVAGTHPEVEVPGAGVCVGLPAAVAIDAKHAEHAQMNTARRSCARCQTFPFSQLKLFEHASRFFHIRWPQDDQTFFRSTSGC